MTVEAQQDSPRKGDGPNDPDVIAGGITFGIEIAEWTARQHVIAAHAEEQTCGAKASGERAAQRGENGDRRHTYKERHPSHSARNIHEGAGNVLKMVAWPGALSQVNFQATEHSRKDTHEHRGQQNVAFRIFN